MSHQSRHHPPFYVFLEIFFCDIAATAQEDDESDADSGERLESGCVAWFRCVEGGERGFQLLMCQEDTDLLRGL